MIKIIEICIFTKIKYWNFKQIWSHLTFQNIFFITDIELSSSTSNENKNSTEKEEQLDLKEKPPQVKSRVKEIQERLTKHN